MKARTYHVASVTYKAAGDPSAHRSSCPHKHVEPAAASRCMARMLRKVSRLPLAGVPLVLLSGHVEKVELQ